MNTILFIDDDTEILRINVKYFSNKAYKVLSTTDSTEAISILEKNPEIRCIILDVMMPQLDGFSLCKKIKQSSHAPIIFLSAKDTTDDKIKGLMLGADDYLTKPYSLKELDVRIQVQLRKNDSSEPSSHISYPPLTIDYMDHKVYCHDEEIHLSNREYELLHLLVTNPNETVTYEAIGNNMWHYYTDSDRRTIMVTASRLRKKLEPYPKASSMIESVWSKGYKFTPR